MNGYAPERLTTEVLILGSGLAGLLLAVELAAAGIAVTLATKSTADDSNSSKAQGGIAAVTPAGFTDTPDLHLIDTLKAGAGLTDRSVAQGIIQEGGALIEKLISLGVSFDRGHSGTLELALEGGHCQPRVVHSKDTTGNAVTATLVDQVRRHPRIRVLEHAFALDLALANGQCQGALILKGKEQLLISCSYVVLATGGTGQIFERTTNPGVATGDGIALAWRAGARLVDMEFVQFHPTALSLKDAPAFLISEAVRGEGAILVDADGNRFAKRFHPHGELATRDVVARGIMTVMKEKGLSNVWLDLRPIGKRTLVTRFPKIVHHCRSLGIDPLSEPVPVAPAAHYFMGGIWTDPSGRTTVPGLYAIGECASIGLHGANRLASNSLLEAGVMALRLARSIGTKRLYRGDLPVRQQMPERAPQVIPRDLTLLKHLMYTHAGLTRDESDLNLLLHALTNDAFLALPMDQASAEAANMLLVSELIVRSALWRRESRGAHYRQDYPNQDENYRARLAVSRDEWQTLPVKETETAPVTALVPA